MDTPNADYDSVWKQAIELYWPDFTELFLFEVWGNRPSPESQDQELAKCARDGKLGLFRVDKLLRAPGADGQPCLWHIEIQVARQRGFAERMFVCQYRLYDHFRLPLRSIAILGDQSPTWRPSRFELIAGHTHTTFEFETIKLRDFENCLADLLLSDNVFAWLVAAHLFTLRTRREPLKRAIVKAKLLTGLRSTGWEQPKFRDVYDLIDRMMSLPKILQERIEKQQDLLEGRNEMAWKYLWEERAEQRGEARGQAIGEVRGEALGQARGEVRGEARGRLETMRSVVCDLLEVRFGQVEDDVRQKVSAGSLEELQRWCLAVVTARSIDEVF